MEWTKLDVDSFIKLWASEPSHYAHLWTYDGRILGAFSKLVIEILYAIPDGRQNKTWNTVS